MKKLLVILFILLNFKIVSASDFKNKVFNIGEFDNLLVCVSEETFEISYWGYGKIKDEILGDFTMITPFGVREDKDGNPVKDPFTKSTITLLNNNFLPSISSWVQLSYDNINLSIKSISNYGYRNDFKLGDYFVMLETIYEFNSSDENFLNEASKKLKEARLNFPKNLATVDDIDAREYFIRNVLVMTKLAGQKEFEMNLDKSYKRKKVTHSCFLK
tara:strand:+ start:75 stop:722 length:648 start_codon:yes stop_codon:yes gene_type:complete